MTITEAGQLIVYVVDEPVDDAAIAAAHELFGGDAVICKPLEPLYDKSISTREAAQILGRLKLKFESMVENGSTVVAICQRHSEDLGTRTHFMASLCAVADQVHFRSNT
jgi:hypothetical protein